MEFVKRKMPAHWASYLINGDASSLEPGERERVDAYLEKSEIEEVIDCADEAHFSWSYDLYGGSCAGGELLRYSVREVQA